MRPQATTLLHQGDFAAAAQVSFAHVASQCFDEQAAFICSVCVIHGPAHAQELCQQLASGVEEDPRVLLFFAATGSLKGQMHHSQSALEKLDNLPSDDEPLPFLKKLAWGLSHRYRGQFVEAALFLSQALECSSAHLSPFFLYIAKSNLASVLVELNNTDAALHLTQEALPLAKEIGSKVFEEAESLRHHHLLQNQGTVEERSSSVLVTSDPAMWFKFPLLLNLFERALLSGHYQNAESLIAKMALQVEGSGNVLHKVRMLLSLSKLEAFRHNLPAAVSGLQQAAGLTEAHFPGSLQEEFLKGRRLIKLGETNQNEECPQSVAKEKIMTLFSKLPLLDALLKVSEERLWGVVHFCVPQACNQSVIIWDTFLGSAVFAHYGSAEEIRQPLPKMAKELLLQLVVPRSRSELMKNIWKKNYRAERDDQLLRTYISKIRSWLPQPITVNFHKGAFQCSKPLRFLNFQDLFPEFPFTRAPLPRQRQFLSQFSEFTLNDYVQTLGVSDSTARRDLQHLQALQMITTSDRKGYFSRLGRESSFQNQNRSESPSASSTRANEPVSSELSN